MNFCLSAKCLIAHKLVQVILDDYGPDLLEAAEESDARYESLCMEQGHLFQRFNSWRPKVSWLRRALSGVNSDYLRLGIGRETLQVLATSGANST